MEKEMKTVWTAAHLYIHSILRRSSDKLWEFCNWIGDSLLCCITGLLYTEGTKEFSVPETGLARGTDTCTYMSIYTYITICMSRYNTCVYIHPATAWQPEYNERNQKAVFRIACSLETGTCEISLLSLPRFLIHPEKPKLNCFEWRFLHRLCQEHVFCDLIFCWCPVASRIIHLQRVLVPRSLSCGELESLLIIKSSFPPFLWGYMRPFGFLPTAHWYHRTLII